MIKTIVTKQNGQDRLTRKHGILSFQDMKSTSWLNSPHLLGFHAGSGGVSAGGRPAARSEEPSSAQLATA
jgi:hypothetical protein